MRRRILMVIHTPWSADLGAPRVQLELGDELQSLGWDVEKFSYEDAFPPSALPTGTAARGLAAGVRRALSSNRSFAARARAHVRANAHRFDVIDANQTDLPFPKRELGFGGLLVARSVGLIPAYREFERMAARKWPEPVSARQMAYRALSYPGARRRRRDVARSFRAADLINVSNQDDLVAVRDRLGFGAKVVCLPFGLSTARREAFLRWRAGTAERLAARTVAFIGAWNSRKGSRDWPPIAVEVLRRVPDARFLFLGTGHDPEFVLRDFSAEVRPRLAVVPAYTSDELPGLLAGATVGAFPGYLEGFGFAVLELLAAGLPTVAYDAPGPREMTSHQTIATTVPAGDVMAFAARLAALLTAAPETYEEIAADSTRVAARFSWPDIARQTDEIYGRRLDALRAAAGTP